MKQMAMIPFRNRFCHLLLVTLKLVVMVTWLVEMAIWKLRLMVTLKVVMVTRLEMVTLKVEK